MGFSYTSREAVKSALDVKLTARDDARVDDACHTGTSMVEKLCHRRFYPWYGTRYFDRPDPLTGSGTRYGWVLDLEADEVISVDQVTTGNGATVIDPADYYLAPANDGPPYDRIELDRGTSASYTASTTGQKSTAVLGTFGHTDRITLATTLDTAVSGTGDVQVLNSGAAGVLDTIRIDGESMTIVGKTQVSTAQTGSLTASQADQALTVADGTQFYPGETLLIGAEYVRVVDVAGNTLIVRRAWDGSTLASHVTATIYKPAIWRVERAQLGTTASVHADGSQVWLHEVPAPVRALARAYAINVLLQDQSGYARVAGSGENTTEYSGRGIKALEAQVWAGYARKGRGEAV